MTRFLHAYRIINILSLDIAAGAMICASFFAHQFDVVILPQGLISLGLTVWIIYTADHLLDAKRLRQDASTERHRFHQRHAGILLVMMIIAIAADGIQIYFIRTIVFIAGLWLAFLVGIYFLIQQRTGFLKELLGALLYTGGVLLIPLSIKKELPSLLILPVLQFGITAWINLLLFSWIDQRRDEKDEHQSFATSLGQKATKKVLVFLFLVSLSLAIAQGCLFRSTVNASIIITLMNAILLLIFLKRDFFEKEDRYRLLGDAVFLLPLVYLLF
jgi:4-hydroxybenzoate polyprenyltransferase